MIRKVVAVLGVTVTLFAAPAGALESFTTGGSGDDKIVGTDVVNRFRGGAGNDRLVGWGGADVLRGGKGDDVIVGGTGKDRIAGGAGTDTCYLTQGDASVGCEILITHV